MYSQINQKTNLSNDILLLLKSEKLYARQIKKKLNMRHDKTLKRILEKLENDGLIQRIEYPDFETEGINDPDRRHIYYKYVETAISYKVQNKRKIWNRIIYRIREIINEYSNTNKISEESDKKILDSLLLEFLGEDTGQTTPTKNYEDVADIKDCIWLSSLLTKLDSDQVKKYQVELVSFIFKVVITAKEHNRKYPDRLISLLIDYFNLTFKKWIELPDKWNTQNPNNKILSQLLIIFSTMQYKELWNKVILKFLDNKNLKNLKEETQTGNPYDNLFNFLKSIWLDEYGSEIKNELAKHEFALFELQQGFLAKDQYDLELSEFYRKIRTVIS